MTRQSPPSDRADSASGAWSDTRVEQIMGSLLRAGVILAAALVLLGGVIYLFRHPGEAIDHRVFHGEPRSLESIWGIVQLAATGSARGLIQVGLLALIATPIARVMFSVYAFARQHDRLYVWITLVVLVLLLYSLIWGRL
jgi:uncharacterized membrane protein